MSATAVVSARGARRWAAGHPWIFRSDVVQRPDIAAGGVVVTDHRGAAIGSALWSPVSEISLRMLDRRATSPPDESWWRDVIGRAVARRVGLENEATAFRIVHGEADGCPSIICDRYDRWLVVQLLSAGAENYRTEIVRALVSATGASGVLARNDAPVRAKEGLDRTVEPLFGDVPREIQVEEHGIKYVAAPWDGQKTGAFLDQRENRELVAGVSRGRALDCFSYHGSFALHMARRAERVTAVDSSRPALERAMANAALNSIGNLDVVEADAFDFLRAQQESGGRYDMIVVDPPAFAKNRGALAAALRGYKEINLRAMRLLSPGGVLFTASCSFHLSREMFLEMLRDAAADSGRRLALEALTGQPRDHPEVVTIPESGYLKGALLRALD